MQQASVATLEHMKVLLVAGELGCLQCALQRSTSAIEFSSRPQCTKSRIMHRRILMHCKCFSRAEFPCINRVAHISNYDSKRMPALRDLSQPIVKILFESFDFWLWQKISV